MAGRGNVMESWCVVSYLHAKKSRLTIWQYVALKDKWSVDTTLVRSNMWLDEACDEGH